MKRFSPTKIMLLTILALSLCVPHLTHATLLDDLALTEDQKVALKELRVETRRNLKAKVEELRELRVQVEDTIFTEEINTDKVNEYIPQINEMQSEISEIVNNAKLEAAQILTPEQRDILSEIKEEKRETINEFKAKWQETRKYLREFLNTLEIIVP
ncbi:hypothetical protein DRH13_06740 [Candidatus Woesebacteria bacterium]|nr:MAG: hypothetical protein DRH13_06740 [Candidatus Woesebacteria bacterium]